MGKIMPTILIDPDEQKKSSRIAGLNAKSNPGLEALTGADFAISNLPIRVNKGTLDWHINNLTFFIQRKSGYDLFSFDALKRSIARMKKCGIPQQQAILLYIGHYYSDENGLCIYDGKQPYGDTTCETFHLLLAEWVGRGGIHYNVNSENDILFFLNGLTGAYKKMRKDGNRVITSDRPSLETETLFQKVEELGSLDFRRILRIGLEGYGEALAESTYTLLNESGYATNLFLALNVLTNLNQEGKMAFSIKGWGMKSCLKLRKILGLRTFLEENLKSVENLSTSDWYDSYSDCTGWTKGWFNCIDRIKELAKAGKDGQEIMEKIEKEVVPF